MVLFFQIALEYELDVNTLKSEVLKRGGDNSVILLEESSSFLNKIPQKCLQETVDDINDMTRLGWAIDDAFVTSLVRDKLFNSSIFVIFHYCLPINTASVEWVSGKLNK